jgi:hypothetical protein
MLIIVLVLLLIRINVDCIELNQTILFETFGYSSDSTYIDLNSLGIDSIESSTFDGLHQLEVLHLQNNKLKRLNKDTFKDLIQLRELSLESNELVAIDKSSFLNLNNLQLVCLNNNPITTLFPTDLLTFVCTNHINCTVSIADKCMRNYTLNRLNNVKLDQFIQFVQSDQNRQDANITDLGVKFNEQNRIIKNQTKIVLSQQDQLFEINEKQSLILTLLDRIIKFNIQDYILTSNIKIDELFIQGFQTVYDQLYSHNTTENELNDVKSKCNKDSIICIGGADSNNKLLLVSCGLCLNILTATTPNQPRLVNGAWWYFTPGKSFGFAPNSTINQDRADNFGCKYKGYCDDPKRLSWDLDGTGGWRLG